MTAIALTIAGSDSGGGAGIQADLKTFSALGVYACSVVAALTAQNTQGVSAIHNVPADFVGAQLEAVLSDLKVNAIKIGMVSQSSIIKVIHQVLQKYPEIPVVFDPVMIATSGDPLLNDEAVACLKDLLVPRADIITPNLYEAAFLIDEAKASDDAAMDYQAGLLLERGARAVLLKGGHGKGPTARDLYRHPGGAVWLSHARFDTKNTHGTGCTLSSALVAYLARGYPLEEALHASKKYISLAIAAADRLDIGKGHGPVHHFYDYWD